MKEHFRDQDQVHPTENVDRARRNLPYRISCGLRVADSFSQLNAMLVLSRGCGKWMRPTVYRTVSVKIPEAVRKFGERIVSAESPSSKDVNLFVADLATVQAEAVNILLSGSVKVLDNVLAICVEDPGLWMIDFDQKWNYQSLCDPCRLAELTGISVIDALPARDIAIGGNGGSLAPLPNWLLFGDRKSTVAMQTRLLINVDQSTELTLLPPSDGLDSELPAIRFSTLPGFDLIDHVAKRMQRADSIHDHDGRIAVQGKRNDEILRTIADSLSSDSYEQAQRGPNREPRRGQLLETIASQIDAFGKTRGIKLSEALCSANHFIADEVGRKVESMDARLKKRNTGTIEQIILSGPGASNGFLQQVIRSVTKKEVVSSEEYGVNPNDLELLVTSVLGLMHIDQLPANIPAITGAECPRLLGRLTPGQPANWRRLLIEMADYRPPAMKLREAV